MSDILMSKGQKLRAMFLSFKAGSTAYATLRYRDEQKLTILKRLAKQGYYKQIAYCIFIRTKKQPTNPEPK